MATTSPTVATAAVRRANCTEELLAGGEWNAKLKIILIIRITLIINVILFLIIY